MMEKRKDKMRIGLSARRVGYHVAAWRHPNTNPAGQESLDFFLTNAQLAEQGKLDFLFFADQLGITAFDQPDGALSHSNENVEFEPLTLLSALAPLTKNIGLIATVSTTYDEPFHVARRFSSLDHLSNGRAGWNVVTSLYDLEGQNFSKTKHLSREARYERAEEFVDVVLGLWNSWDDDAFIRDKASGIFYDPKKLRVLNHIGKHFQVRGPLSASRTPQGRPIVVCVGTSEAGRQNGAQFADLYYVSSYDIIASQDFYSDIKGRLSQFGRRPDDLKILPSVQIFVGRTKGEAQEKFDYLQSLIDPIAGYAAVWSTFGDLSRYDPDGPIPHEINAPVELSSAINALNMARKENLTVRQLCNRFAGKIGVRQIVGTPDEIVKDLEAWYHGRACDGFNIAPAQSPDGIRDFIELVIPELQERNLFRTEYEGTTLRENLGLPYPGVSG